MKYSTVTAMAIFVLLLVLGGIYGGYKYGSNKAYVNGYSAGYKNAPKPDKYKESQYSILKSRLAIMESSYRDLSTKYNQLAIQASRKSLNCLSTQYGIDNQFTSTNCY